jgi:hypothetical protein
VSRIVLALALLVAVATYASPVIAHPLQFGSLRIEEARDGTLTVAFRFSGTELQPGNASIVMPTDCRDIVPADEASDAIGTFSRRRVRCSRGLEGRDVRIDGLASRECQVLVTFVHADGREERSLVDSTNAIFRASATGAVTQVGPRYFALGIEHILTGLDHLAFVAALMLLVGTRGRLLATITSFTAGHSITLSAATLGLLHVPAAPIEASIALSIVLVAHEAIHTERETLTRRHPWIVAGLFGLLHGLGFAGALASVGLPRAEIPLALATFNLGVEAGQIGFVAASLVIARIATSVPRLTPTALRRATIYGIGTFAMYLLLDRTATLLA